MGGGGGGGGGGGKHLMWLASPKNSKKSVMEAAQSTFISSTFWTERIGPTAALATLKVMEREQSWNKISDTGKKMQNGWLDLAKKNNLNITISGIPAMTSYSFNSRNALEYKTLIAQEMLKKGYLASTIFYACTEHTEEHLDNFFEYILISFHLSLIS